MYHSIRPGQIWLDTEGKRIQAHGGSVMAIGDTFYWYGENKEKTTGGDSRLWHWGVRCYSSKDLYNWKDEGVIIPPDEENENSPLHPMAKMDRPHIVYNEKTKKYTAWLKIMGETGGFAVLTADHILGPYEMVDPCVKPCGLDVGDFDIVVDEKDKKAYLYSECPHTMLYCAELNDTYTGDAGIYTAHFQHDGPPENREAPAHFIRNNRHYLLTSGTTGYHPNPSEAAVADDWHGPFEILGDPHVNDSSRTSFNSQISSVFRHPLKKDLYIAVADRWLPKLAETEGEEFANGEGYKKTAQKFREIFDPNIEFVLTEEEAKELYINSSQSDYVWLPLKFEGDKVLIEWLDEWRIEDYE